MTIVFVGPTLSRDEVTALLPAADVRPPVALGDVLALALAKRRPARLAIIDGYFERMAAVWHKEILFAIERGIEVWGASSMGALRAAELAPFGMIGVGDIYRAFARDNRLAGNARRVPTRSLGALTADDEVAVAHLPAEQGYRAVSDALVNLREGIAKAPMLTDKTRATLVELARGRFYRERTWAQLIADARATGVPAKQLDAFAAWPKPDRKAADARLLLAKLAKLPSSHQRQLASKPPSAVARRAKRPQVTMPRTWAFEQLVEIVRSRPRARRPLGSNHRVAG